MKNKNIIITGTSRGIGYELALQFANAGHQVLAISRKIPKELIENPNITCLSIDISNPEELYKTLEEKLEKSYERALAESENHLTKNMTYYVKYIEMRSVQFEIMRYMKKYSKKKLV